VSREQALYRAFDELTDRSIRFVRVYSIDMWDEEAHAWVATNDHARAGRSGRPPEGH
jgi:hypothetical protein